jgi:hypothetical protein
MKASEEAEEEALRQTGLAVAEAMINGDNPWPLISQYRNMPGAEASDVLAFESAWERVRDDHEERAADFDAVADLELGLMEGTMGLYDIYEAYNEGQLGGGKAGKSEFGRMLSRYSTIRNQRRSENRTRLTPYEREIKETFDPARGGSLPDDPVKKQIRIEALREFQERTRNGEDPREAADEVLNKYGESLERRKANAGQGTKIPAPTAIKSLAQGRLPAEEFLQQGIRAQEIRDLLDMQEITTEEAALATSVLMESRYPLLNNQ